MEPQVIIDNAESLARDMESLHGFTKLMCDFTSKPISKKQLKDFCEKYVMDRFLGVQELKDVYARTTLDATNLNAWELRKALTTSHSPQATVIIDNIRSRMSGVILAVLEYVGVLDNQIKENNFPDTAERLMALRRAVCKINDIFIAPRQLPIDVDQFPLLETGLGKEIYLTRDLAYCINMVKDTCREQFDVVDNWILFNDNDTANMTVYPSLCKNNWVSLRNFVIYLKSFTEY